MPSSFLLNSRLFKTMVLQIMGFASMSHGDIFAQFFTEVGDDDLTLNNFMVQDWVGENSEEKYGDEDDAKWVKKLKRAYDKQDAITYWVEYFKERSSHGEYAGQVARACFNTDAYEAWKKISKHFSPDGWDS